MRALPARAALAAAPLLLAALACARAGRPSADHVREQIRALERERDSLRERMNELMARDPRLPGMPETGVKVGVPTSLARDLIQRVVAGFVDQVTLELKNLKVARHGRVRKLVTIGEYDVHVTITRVTGRLRTGKPDVTFGGNRVGVSMPVTVASGSGRATIRFDWDGKNLAGATCGDVEVTREVSGGVRPETYPVSGALVLTATAQEILAEPRFPPIRIKLKVNPSAESWDAVDRILDEKEGLCGYVVDKVDVRGMLEGLVDRGFIVRLPTEKIKPMTVPVGIEPTMEVQGYPVALGIKVARLAVTEQMIWLGADVSLTTGAEAAAKSGAARAPVPKGPTPKPTAAKPSAR